MSRYSYDCNACDDLSDLVRALRKDLDSAREEIDGLRRENMTFQADRKAWEACVIDDPAWISPKEASLEAEVIALRKDLDDALSALRALREGDAWWLADEVLARFDAKATE